VNFLPRQKTSFKYHLCIKIDAREQRASPEGRVANMLKKYLLLSVPAISLMVLAFETPEIKNSFSPYPILCIGDSTLYACEGTSVSREGFPEQLAELSGLPVINDGICGGTTTLAHVNLVARHNNEHFSAIIIRVGLNDLRFKVWSPDAYRNLLIEAKKRADEVYVVAWECANNEMDATNPVIEKIAREQGCTYLVPGLSGSDFNRGDPIHPNRTGGRKIAEVISRELSSHALTN
jgi:lysophospholipase L1-like esterase